MFWVFNKDKIVSYVVTVFTVAILFFTASIFSKTEEIIETSANNYEPENNVSVNGDGSLWQLIWVKNCVNKNRPYWHKNKHILLGQA